MNKVLIHSNNTSFSLPEIFPISEQYVFDVDFDTDIDIYIDKILSDGELHRKLINTDIVFIKVALSKNYLEYLGVRLAYHIRLTKCLGIKSHIPIVIIAEESYHFLGNTLAEPSILFTGGIYIIKESLIDYYDILKLYRENRIKSLENFSTFLNSINIKPPANYQSHHSTANEWALARYYSMLEIDIDNEKFLTLSNKIQDLPYVKSLHFKFIEAKSTRQKFKTKDRYYPYIDGLENTTIGIIDDDINNGWLAFYDYIFSISKAKVVAFNDFNKYESKHELISKIQNWLIGKIKNNDPISLFIIDLRLHDDDFSESDFENLSGIQLIKILKGINPGAQIVISSASNKIWNFQKCLDQGVSYYTIKESPETYNTREETKASLLHFNKQIRNANQRSKLALLYFDIESLKNNNIFHKNSKEKEFEKLTFDRAGLLDQIYNLLLLDINSETIINQCLLLAFQVLENYCDLTSVGSFGNDSTSGLKLSSGFVWLKSSTKKDIFINQPNQKISTFFQLEYGKFDFQTHEAKETPINFVVFDKMKTDSSYHSGVDVTSLVKLISVLYFRDNIPHNDIKLLIKLRYYRSNIAAHLTNKIKPGYQKLNIEDISFFFRIFKQIFL